MPAGIPLKEIRLQNPVTDREFIKASALSKEEENDAFREYLQNTEGNELDETVHRLNNIIAPQIDCTSCGACCRQLMINVTPEESITVAHFIGKDPRTFKEEYLEESMQGNMIMNAIPCAFLKDSKCTVYRERFNECRAFPHLHETNFKGRLFGTLIHYAMCPIIYNVVEELKTETGFRTGVVAE
ncbi:MAG: YkgJ family cysteine cluster protein [Ferruginibacter sp.]